jgi:ATP-dependent Clp protease adapter protein ClpS
MVRLNVHRHGAGIVGLVSQEQVDALVGRYRGLSLAQRFAYDHSSSTKYSSLYTLVDYAAERVGAGGS